MPKKVDIDDVENLSPHKLLRHFSKNRVLPCIILALMVHVLVIGGSSAEFIYYTWIDPSANPDAATAGQPGEQPGEGAPGSTPAAGDPSEEKPGDAENGAGDEPSEPGGNGSTTPPDEDQTPPVVKRITEKASPDEIPADPDDFGISIEDTNR